ncbi:MAG: diaminopimelate decarboxylase [Gammaproteobacteria bacterium]|nr:diaminopimelate decarboxylase [Gammaproteobacteria bacterium]MDA8011535.1 diaminopimelate decarboxylase [Gammaproteobacteria bacterium]
MDHFQYAGDALHAEQVPLAEIAARAGTPCYVYSRATIERHWRAFDEAFGGHPHRICYAVKANGNLAVLNLLARLGSGFDIVSGGELRRVIAAGGDPGKTIFSGVGKQDWEIREALAAGIACFNIESESEAGRVSALAAEHGRPAAISVRLNPDVDAKAHPYLSTGLRENKFGVDAARAAEIYRRAHADPNLRISGVACHIGSQLTDLAPYRDALRRVLDFADELAGLGIEIDHIDFGGGLGVRYRDETPPTPAEYCEVITREMRARKKTLPVVIEPGRAILGNAGVLLTRVLCIKRGAVSDFCVVDAGMNDLLRPALYQAYQEIVEVERRPRGEAAQYDVVGPVCESGDFLGKARRLNVRESDLLAVRTAGAYAAVMSSNYNARPRPPEVIVDGGEFHLARARESLEDLHRGERVLPE